jgi:hypothetical protein
VPLTAGEWDLHEVKFFGHFFDGFPGDAPFCLGRRLGVQVELKLGPFGEAGAAGALHDGEAVEVEPADGAGVEKEDGFLFFNSDELG